MINHFKTALKDPEFIEAYKNKPFHRATLHALAKYVDSGHKIGDLPWFDTSKFDGAGRQAA